MSVNTPVGSEIAVTQDEHAATEVAGLERAGFDRIDRVNGGLRVLAALATLSYPLLDTPKGAEVGDQVLYAVLVFAGYSVLLYAAFWRLFVQEAVKSRFYIIAALTDLVFTVYVIWLTGGASSPFFRALYLWVAMLAFFFGMRGGVIASSVALVVLTMFLVRADVPLKAWESLVKLGGLVMHGPLIGGLVDAKRRRGRALERVNKAYEEALIQLKTEQSHTLRLQKLTSMGLIAAGLAHEINNPLQGAIGAVQALRRGNLSLEREETYLEVVETGLARVKGTVVTLLDYSRKGMVSKSRMEVRAAVEQAVSLLKPVLESANVTLNNEVNSVDVVVIADKSRLQQALANVLMNAIHAAGDRGLITIALSRATGKVGIRITDDGPGIATEDMDKVCDPFFTTKPVGVGTGLGLAITLRILKDHGGDLQLQSKPGKGAVVTLWLPQDEELPIC
jgi:signal transduction histidine kinase